jgi:hypothetical protein
MPIPVTSIIFHAFFLKIFNLAGIIIVEFLAIFIFLLIFYKIFSYFFSENESIALSLFFFMIPILIKVTNLDSIPYLYVVQNDFYSLRPPRPLISSLYFFSFVYLLIFMDSTKIFEKKRLALLGLIMGCSLSSYYYFFVIEFLTLLFFLIYKFKLRFIKELADNYRGIFISIIVFLITISPFIVNLIYHETDLTERMGSFALTAGKKSTLIKYYFSQYFKLNFLFLFIFSIFCIYFSNKKKINHFRFSNILFIIFLSTIFSPIFFILISPKSSLLYHFNNAIVTWGFIFFTVFLIILIKHYFKFRLKTLATNMIIFFLICIYCINFYYEKNLYFKNSVYKDRRIEFEKITKMLSNNKNVIFKDSSILTFDNELMVWAILNEVKYLSLSNGLFVPKTHEMIEEDLIKNFKFLNLGEKDFSNFFKNKKRGWRYLNKNVSSFTQYRYQANSLNTFQDSKNFDPNIKKFILATSPIMSQQIAIPNEEFERLRKKFISYKLSDFKEPEIIVLEKTKPITANIVIKKQDYCKIYNGNTYILYLRKNSKIKCN